MSDDKLAVGIIGIGWWGRGHARGLCGTGRAEVVAISRRNPERLGDKPHQCRIRFPLARRSAHARFEHAAPIRELRDDGCAVFMSTHDVFRASDVSDRVGIMKEGRLIMVRSADELVDQDLRHIYLDYMKN